jgi:hypothetical protein
MAVGIFLGIERVRNGRRREDQQRCRAAIDLAIEIEADAALDQDVQLVEAVMPVRRRVAPKNWARRPKVS